jgi:hypothetical protein
MTMPPVPIALRRRMSVWLPRCVGAVGVLLFATFFTGYLAGSLPAPVPRNHSFVVGSGSPIYLLTEARQTTWCDVGWAGGHGAVSLPPGRLEGMAGARISRPVPGPLTVECDGTVRLSTGPLVHLYPVAQWGSPVLLVASFCVVGWWEFGRRSGRWTLLGSATRRRRCRVR